MKLAALALALAATSACDGTTVDALDGPGACFSASRDPGEPARPADDVVDSLGLKPSQLSAGDPITRERFSELGVRHTILGNVPFPTESRALAQALDLHGIVTVENVDDAATALAFFGDRAIAITYRNNDAVVPGWGDFVRSSQQKLWDTVKNNPATRDIQVVGPNAESDAQIAAVGDLSAWVDFGSCFPYGEGRRLSPPGPRAESDLARHAAVYPNKPFVVPQVGYSTEVGGVTELVQAKYTTRMLLEHMRLGIRRTYILDLSDSRDAPDGYGIVHGDGAPKPAFTALRRLIELVADPGPAFAPGRLAFALVGAPADVHQMLLQKRNGVFYLALWREIASTDEDAGVPVVLQLALPARSLKAYAPLAQAAPVAVGSGSSFTVVVSDAPSLVVIEPGCR